MLNFKSSRRLKIVLIAQKSNVQIVCFALLFLSSLNVFSQSFCDENIKKAKEFITGTDVVVKDGIRALELLDPCVVSGHPEAIHIMGLAFMGANAAVKSNQITGLRLLKQAAELGNAEAACNVAIAYKKGQGCEIDFDQAIEWYKKAYQMGSSKAAFKLGYMYYKGLGSVDQSYDQAIEWFNKSDYPLTTYYSGIQNFFGFGMPKNEEKALEILLSNNESGLNEGLANHFFGETPPKAEPIKSTEAYNEATTNLAIGDFFETAQTIQEEAHVISLEKLTGDWKGTLIELDWSKKFIMRKKAIELNFENADGGLEYNFKFKDTTVTNTAVKNNNELLLTDLKLPLPRIYFDYWHSPYVLFNTITINLAQVDNLNDKYLIANVNANMPEFGEPAPPLRLVLVKQLSDNNEDESTIDQETLEQLAINKGDNFIKTFPNPFKDDLLIEYEITETSNVSVKLFSYLEQTIHNISTEKEELPGKHTHYFDGASLDPGLYIVKVSTRGSTHTKLIVKQ